MNEKAEAIRERLHLWDKKYPLEMGSEREKLLFIIAADAIAALDSAPTPEASELTCKDGLQVQSAPSKEEPTIWMDHEDVPLSKALPLLTDEWIDGGQYGDHTVIDLRDIVIVLRAQLAESSKLQGYLDEECRLRREAETRAEVAEAQLAERARNEHSCDTCNHDNQHGFCEIGRVMECRSCRIYKPTHPAPDFWQARAALDGKEPPHA